MTVSETPANGSSASVSGIYTRQSVPTGVLTPVDSSAKVPVSGSDGFRQMDPLNQYKCSGLSDQIGRLTAVMSSPGTDQDRHVCTITAKKERIISAARELQKLSVAALWIVRGSSVIGENNDKAHLRRYGLSSTSRSQLQSRKRRDAVSRGSCQAAYNAFNAPYGGLSSLAAVVNESPAIYSRQLDHMPRSISPGRIDRMGCVNNRVCARSSRRVRFSMTLYTGSPRMRGSNHEEESR
jgi:hypothetical protein